MTHRPPASGRGRLGDTMCSCPIAGESMADPSYAPQNRLLSRLTAEDLALLKPDLTHVDLPLGKQLEAPGKRINYVYFIDSGFASVVADGIARNKIEVGMIGR